MFLQTYRNSTQSQFSQNCLFSLTTRLCRIYIFKLDVTRMYYEKWFMQNNAKHLYVLLVCVMQYRKPFSNVFKNQWQKHNETTFSALYVQYNNLAMPFKPIFLLWNHIDLFKFTSMLLQTVSYLLDQQFQFCNVRLLWYSLGIQYHTQQYYNRNSANGRPSILIFEFGFMQHYRIIELSNFVRSNQNAELVAIPMIKVQYQIYSSLEDAIFA